MKSRTLILIALGLILLGIVAVAYAFLSQRVPEEPVPSDTRPTDPFGSSPDTSGGTLTTHTILTKEGMRVTVPDFTSGKASVALTETPGDAQYDLTPYAEYEIGKPYETHAFDVQYNALDSTFVVTLNEEPLGASRLASEAFLRSTLELTDAQLCTLSVSVGVPFSVNETLSVYENLGLSFCPRSYPLPS